MMRVVCTSPKSDVGSRVTLLDTAFAQAAPGEAAVQLQYTSTTPVATDQLAKNEPGLPAMMRLLCRRFIVASTLIFIFEQQWINAVPAKIAGGTEMSTQH